MGRIEELCKKKTKTNKKSCAHWGAETKVLVIAGVGLKTTFYKLGDKARELFL
jgi:hypothetical protein